MYNKSFLLLLIGHHINCTSVLIVVGKSLRFLAGNKHLS